LDAKTDTGIHAKILKTLTMQNVKNLFASLIKLAQNTWLHQFWRKKLIKASPPKLTADEIEVRIWAFVVITVVLILFFIVVSLIYRTTFVIQPIKQISPLDVGDQKMLNDIVLLIVGGIGGIMGRKGIRELSENLAKPAFTATFESTTSKPTFSKPIFTSKPEEREAR
jgi:hypothetical protein